LEDRRRGEECNSFVRVEDKKQGDKKLDKGSETKI
jgi:hypothetical protein